MLFYYAWLLIDCAEPNEGTNFVLAQRKYKSVEMSYKNTPVHEWHEGIAFTNELRYVYFRARVSK